MAENDMRENRRNSILKQVDMNFRMANRFYDDENEPTSTVTMTNTRRQSRRVSFAEKTEIKEFRKHEAIIPISPEPVNEENWITSKTLQTIKTETVSKVSPDDGMDITYVKNTNIIKSFVSTCGGVIDEVSETMCVSIVSQDHSMEVTQLRESPAAAVSSSPSTPQAVERSMELETPSKDKGSVDATMDCSMEVDLILPSAEPVEDDTMQVTMAAESSRLENVSLPTEEDIEFTMLASDSTQALLKPVEHTQLPDAMDSVLQPSFNLETAPELYEDVSHSTLNFLQNTLQVSCLQPMEELHLTAASANSDASMLMPALPQSPVRSPARENLSPEPTKRVQADEELLMPQPAKKPCMSIELNDSAAQSRQEVDEKVLAETITQEQDFTSTFSSESVKDDFKPESPNPEPVAEIQEPPVSSQELVNCEVLSESAVPQLPPVVCVPEPEATDLTPALPSADHVLVTSIVDLVPEPPAIHCNPSLPAVDQVPETTLVPDTPTVDLCLPLPLMGSTPLLPAVNLIPETPTMDLVAEPSSAGTDEQPEPVSVTQRSPVEDSGTVSAENEKPKELADGLVSFFKTWKWGLPWKAERNGNEVKISFRELSFIVKLTIGNSFTSGDTVHYYITSHQTQTLKNEVSEPFKMIGFDLLENTVVKSDLKKLCPTTKQLPELVQHVLNHKTEFEDYTELDWHRFLCCINVDWKVDVPSRTIEFSLSNVRRLVKVWITMTLRDTFPLKIATISMKPVFGTLNVEQAIRTVKQISPGRRYLGRVGKCLEDYVELKE